MHKFLIPLEYVTKVCFIDDSYNHSSFCRHPVFNMYIYMFRNTCIQKLKNRNIVCAKILLCAYKEVGSEINSEKYVLMFRQQNEGQH